MPSFSESVGGRKGEDFCDEARHLNDGMGGSQSDGGGGGRNMIGGSSLVKKLGHPLEEIRCRALKTLLQKLDLGFVSVADLGVRVELVKTLLQWFNFPSSALRDETLNLLLLISKEESGCKSLAALGAIQFLTDLRMEASALESQSVDAIMQNVIVKTDATVAHATASAGSAPYATTAFKRREGRTGDEAPNAVPLLGTGVEERSDRNDGNNNEDPSLPRATSCGGETPRGILRDLDPQMLRSRGLRTVLNPSPPSLPPCDAATLASAISAIYEAASAAAVVEGPFRRGDGTEAEADSAAAEAMRSTLTFVEDVVLKDFPIEYLLTAIPAAECGGGQTVVNDGNPTEADGGGNDAAASSFGVDLFGALIDAVLTWKDKATRASSRIDGHLRLLVRLLDTLERFVDKLSEAAHGDVEGHFRRQFVVEEDAEGSHPEVESGDFDGEDEETENIHLRSETDSNHAPRAPSNPFRWRSERSAAAPSSVLRVNVCIAASVIVETLCGVVSDVLRPLDRQFYQSTTTTYSKKLIGRGARDEDDDDDVDPLLLYTEDPLLLRVSVIVVDVVAKSSSLLLDSAPSELDWNLDGGRDDDPIDAAAAVFDRCLTALGDAVARLAWRTPIDGGSSATSSSHSSLSRPSAPSRSQLWTYVHLGSSLSVLSRGFLRFTTFLMDRMFSSSSSSALHPLLRRRRRLDPHDLLPPSCVSSLLLLALDPFFHALFPHARADSLLPILSHVRPVDAGKIVDALDVCAVLTEAHFRLVEGVQRGRAGAACVESSSSFASIVSYLTYTQSYDVIPDVVDNIRGDSSTLVRLLAHPSLSIRARVYASLADVVVRRLDVAGEKAALQSPTCGDDGFGEDLRFLMATDVDETGETTKATAKAPDLWRELVLYGLNDPSTSQHVERLLTAVIDQRRVTEDSFSTELIERCVVPFLPFLTGFPAVKHSFASTILSLLSFLTKGVDVERVDGVDESRDRFFRNGSIRMAVLRSTLALLFSRDKEWRQEGMRRFLSLNDAGASFLGAASVVEVEIFADAFVKKTAPLVISGGRGVDSSSLEDVRRIFSNEAAAADVRSTAARTLANAIVDRNSCAAALGVIGGRDDVFSVCLVELRRADNNASPPVLSIDDVVPAVTQLLAKLVLGREFRRKLSTANWRWKCRGGSAANGGGTAPESSGPRSAFEMSSQELILMLCRLCLKYRKNSDVVENCAALFAAFAFAGMEEEEEGKEEEDEDHLLRFGQPKFPASILRRFSLPSAIGVDDDAAAGSPSPNCDPSLMEVHRRLNEDGTLSLVKHCWNALGRIVGDQSDGGDVEGDGALQSSPLDYSAEEDWLASLFNVEFGLKSASRHLSSASCHEDVAIAVTFLCFPALSRGGGAAGGGSGGGGERGVEKAGGGMDDDITSATEGEEEEEEEGSSPEKKVMRDLHRFFASPPSSDDDEELFLLVLKLLKKKLDYYFDLDPADVHELVLNDSFPLFLRELLSRAVSSTSASSSATLLLGLLAHPPSPLAFSFNVMTICVNWLGSGLDLSRPGVVPVVEAATSLIARTIAAKMDAIVDEGDHVLKEALRILCLHCCNVIRLLLARRSPNEVDPSFDTSVDPSLVFGASAIESAANALLVAFQALKRIDTAGEFGEFVLSTLLVIEGEVSSARLWFHSALSSPSPFLASLFWTLLRLCCGSSSSALALLLRRFPDFFRVCVETATGVVESSSIVEREVLRCLLLSAHGSTTERANGQTEGRTDVADAEESLRKLFIRFDFTENVMTTLPPSTSEADPSRLEMSVLKLRLLKWFVERDVLDERRITALAGFLVDLFVNVPIPSKIGDGDEDGGGNENGKESGRLDLRVEYLAAIADVLLSLVSLPLIDRLDADANAPLPPFLNALFDLSSDFFNRAFGLLSIRFVGFGDALWRQLMRLISKLVARLSTTASSVLRKDASSGHVSISSASSSSSSLYPVAIAMLENKDSLMPLFIHSSSFSRRLLSTSLLTSLYRFCAFLLTRLGRDADCLEVLDGLLDIPHGVDSDETHGSLLATAVYQQFVGGSRRVVDVEGGVGEFARDSFSSPPFLPPSTTESAAASVLQCLVVVSSTAKTAALYDLGLVDLLVSDSLSLEASLSLDSLNGAHNGDGSIPASDAVLQHLLARLGVLTNLMLESQEARSLTMTPSPSGATIAPLFHRLWSWVEVDDSVAEAFFRCLGAFAADNPVGIANALCVQPKFAADAAATSHHSATRSSSSTSSISGKASPLLGSPTFLSPQSASLVHSMTLYASQTRPRNDLLRRRCFVLLGKMAALSAEVRGVLTKTHFLENGFCRLNPKAAVSPSSSAFPLHSAWLDFVCTLTTAVDGQSMVFKAHAAVDLLLEYLSLANPSSSSSSSSSLSSLRQKSALALHNLCFSSKNAILLTRGAFLPTFIRRATQLSFTPHSVVAADRKTTLICCAALWALATRLKKNASLMKGSDCGARLKEVVYRLSRSCAGTDDGDEELTAKHLLYCQKIISVLDS